MSLTLTARDKFVALTPFWIFHLSTLTWQQYILRISMNTLEGVLRKNALKLLPMLRL